MINKLDKKSIDRIHSEQIIKNIVSVVKELIDNAIDAKSTKIIINLKNFGIEEIIVTDNGFGICKDDLQKLGLRGTTSKLNEGDVQLNEINFLGFRVRL